jgi:hypothetical protein
MDPNGSIGYKRITEYEREIPDPRAGLISGSIGNDSMDLQAAQANGGMVWTIAKFGTAFCLVLATGLLAVSLFVPASRVTTSDAPSALERVSPAR